MERKLRKYLASLPGTHVLEWRENEGTALLASRQLAVVISYLRKEVGNDLVYLTHVVTDEREIGGGFVLHLLLNLPQDFTITLKVRAIEENLPSLASLYPALNWAEREAQDLFGLCFAGHPDPRPLVLHPGWPDGFYPLRKDCVKPGQLGEFTPKPLQISPAEGEGVFEVPVGPIHAGIIEPGHFRFQTVGEVVLHLEAQLFYTHKGLEKLLEGQDVWKGLAIIERACGVCSVSHALAYCEALEKIANFQPTRMVQAWRTVVAELERLYNHIGDIGNACSGVGFALGTANGLQCKERLQRLNKVFFGHRFLRGVVVPGGIKSMPELPRVSELRTKLRQLLADFEGWIPLLLEHDGFRQRAVTTGILKYESAVDLGVTGPAARASGVAIDWRSRHPHLLYPELGPSPVVETTGDVWARLMVRVGEVRESFAILFKLLSREYTDSEDSASAKLCSREAFETLPAWQSAWGCAESPRGTDVVWLMTDGEGKIYRCRIRSASYANWPAVPLAVLGNIIPDFPLINKSFELCYSCCDR